MNDDRVPTPDSAPGEGPTPNRGRRREPPVIDVAPVDAQTIAPAEAPKDDAVASDKPAPEAEASVQSAPAEPAAPETLSAQTASPESISEPAPREIVHAGVPLLSLIAASVGAAALSAIAVFSLQPSAKGVDPAAFSRLEERTASVERGLESAAKAVAARPGADLERRLVAAEAQGKAIEQQAGVAMAQAEKAIAQSAAPAALAPLDARLSALEKAIAAKPVGDAGPALASLEGRLKDIENSLAAPKSEGRATQTRVEAQAPAQPAVDLAPLENRVAGLEAQLKPLEGRVEPLAPALADVRASLEALAARTLQAQAQSQSEAKTWAEAQSQLSVGAAQALVAQAALGKLDAGEPFAQEIDALAGLGLTAPQIEPLRAFAAKGAATSAALGREFAALEPKLRSEAPAASGSILDRLAQSAGALVRVRPVGEPSGDSPSDVTARIERALASHDVAGALVAWDKLPEGAKAVSSDWAQRARARLACEQALRAIMSDAIARLGKLKS